AEAEPHPRAQRMRRHARSTQEQQPDEQVSGQDGRRARCGAIDEHAGAAAEQHETRCAGERLVPWQVGRNWLPVEREIAGDEAQETDPREAAGEKQMSDSVDAHHSPPRLAVSQARRFFAASAREWIASLPSADAATSIASGEMDRRESRYPLVSSEEDRSQMV